MRLRYKNGVVEDDTLVLAKRNFDKLGQLCNVSDYTYKRNMNSANEISFKVTKTDDEKLWTELYDLRLIWIKEKNEYFEIRVDITDSTLMTKSVTGISLCEAELSQTQLRNIEINTESDILRDDYVITKFYNPSNHKGSLLHRILEKVPHYHIGHVDESLMNLQRTFSINGSTIYDFLTGECSEQFNCLFIFDSATRTINVYDLYTVCLDCGYRNDYLDVCPECGSKHLKYYGKDTSILVSVENLTDEVTYTTDVDSIKNCFKMQAGDELMTAAVINSNPNGSAYLYYFAEETLKDMSPELVTKLKSYDVLVKNNEPEYRKLMEDYYNALDQRAYYQSSMMPEGSIQEFVNASTEAAKLTTANLSPMAIPTVSASSKTTVESALKTWAKAFILTGYVSLDINESIWTYNSGNTGTWRGNFKITSMKDNEDIAYSSIINVTVNNDYQTYINQKVIKQIQSTTDDKYDILNYNPLASDFSWDKFKDALTKFSYTRLKSFADAYGAALDVLVQVNQASKEADLYSVLYQPYYQMQKCVIDEMNAKQSIIDGWNSNIMSLERQIQHIQDILNFEKYLGTTLYEEFSMYRREDTYQNNNYISDGLDNAELVQKSVEFIEEAKKQIVESGEYQHSISSTLYNLMLISEFEPLLDNFEIGNWIRIKVDNDIYRLRLISYTEDHNSLSTIPVEFSSVTKTTNGVNDIKTILDQSKSMASSYSYVSKQAIDGSEAFTQLKNFVVDGLDSSLINIKNNNREEVTYDSHGIICKSFDDITENYSPEQLRITHNILAFTDDNWESVTTALGKHDYIKYDESTDSYIHDTAYGLSASFVAAGYIYGSQIIGGDIYSENYSATNHTGSYINLNDGTFDLGGGSLKYNGSTLTISNSNIDKEIEEALKDINIGGTQILRGTNTLILENNGKWNNSKWIKANSSAGGTATVVDVVNNTNPNIKKGIHFVNPSTASINTNTPICQFDVPLTSGESYIMSCMVYGQGLLELTYGGKKNNIFKGQYFEINSQTWTKIVYKFVASEDGILDNKTNVYYALRGAGDIHICGMKLEIGSIATEWSESPLDTQSDISQKMSIADYCVANDTTFINGGKIYTGSITSQQIDVDELFAQDLTATNFHLKGGSIDIETNSSTFDVIKLKYNKATMSLKPHILSLNDETNNNYLFVSTSGIEFSEINEGGTKQIQSFTRYGLKVSKGNGSTYITDNNISLIDDDTNKTTIYINGKTGEINSNSLGYIIGDKQLKIIRGEININQSNTLSFTNPGNDKCTHALLTIQNTAFAGSGQPTENFIYALTLIGTISSEYTTIGYIGKLGQYNGVVKYKETSNRSIEITIAQASEKIAYPVQYSLIWLP